VNSAFVYFNNPEGFFNSLKISELESNFRRLSENSGIFSETDTEIILSGEFFNIEGVVSVESLSEMSLLSQVSSGTSGGFAINEDENINYIKNNPNLNLTGRNVIIAIADTGIDYLHPDFINADGTSKILYLWDQTKEGNSPEGFYFGTEYTRDDINRAISENDSTLSTDEVGSGTLLSGICAGLGVSNSLYEGVAKDSELIVIKLGTIDGKYNNAYYYVARDYARKKARELERPLIINTSVGTNSDVGFINRATQSTIWYQYGECEIAGIGNEGNTQTHASGKISAEGETQTVEIEIEEEEEFLKIELWICRPDRVNIKIISPTGEESKDVGLGYYKNESGIFNFENTTYTVFYVFPTSYSGQEFITINLYNASPGIWKINLTGVYINSGCYNVYLPNRSLINQNTRFLEPDPFYTVNFPTVDRNIFTVGAYDMINNSMWPPSSRGPNIRNIQKPNIVAPGVNIISAYPHNRYGNITGTSAAAAVTSGVAALFLQYVTQNNQYKRQGFTQSIYSFFQLGADREDNIQYPNFIYGYGLLNARKIFEEFR
ncbi:MAG: S8 family serine peptidase, partial [Intestinibacter bartlettii]